MTLSIGKPVSYGTENNRLQREFLDMLKKASEIGREATQGSRESRAPAGGSRGSNANVSVKRYCRCGNCGAPSQEVGASCRFCREVVRW